MTTNIAIGDFDYSLPDERIATYPVVPRDASKLLLYRSGEIAESKFKNLPDYLPENAFLVFNNTRVIPARLHFQKPTGAIIEVFLLHPTAPSTVISEVMASTNGCTWQCIIGNKKRWKNEPLTATLTIDDQEVTLTATLVDAETNEVAFTWISPPKGGESFLTRSASTPSLRGRTGVGFVDIVNAFGEMPLPPYMNRPAEEKDLESYQTVYSEHDGAVAAPTAGLHFTDDVLDELKKRGFRTDFVTLHVGAGTFQPVKTENALEHPMHEEQVVFTLDFIKKLKGNAACVIPVGTTSMRSLESLYWYGVKLKQEKTPTFTPQFYIEQDYPYQHEATTLPDLPDALGEVITLLEETNRPELVGETQIYIYPGYEMRVCRGIITNFHQPKSTLLLLIAALVGNDWQRIYAYALQNGFRFLSYGDSSLLLP